MKIVITIIVFFLHASYGMAQVQRIFTTQEIGVSIISIPSKFYRSITPGFFISNQDRSIFRSRKTVFCVETIPTVKLYGGKRINFIAGGGLQVHRVRNDFNDNSPRAINNVLWKIQAGTELFVLGKRTSVLSFRLQTLLSYEDFIRNKSGFYRGYGPFNLGVFIFDYAGNPARTGLDILPLISGNLNNNLAFQIGAGYSFGLNRSNRRIVLPQAQWNEAEPLVLFFEKESAFVFSAGLYYNLSKQKRRSFKNWKFSELTNKIFYNQ
jgi:hypothetical protein